MDDILQGQWKQLRGKIKEQWGNLTDDDLDRVNGQYDQLVGALQERYGYGKVEAEAKLSDFLKAGLGSRRTTRRQSCVLHEPAGRRIAGGYR